MSKRTVILIDDDEGPLRYYEEALRDAEFEVLRRKDFAEALAFIRDPNPMPNFWVLDVMMPPGDKKPAPEDEELFKSTMLGLGSGIVLYRQLKKKNPTSLAILLTSITTPKLLDEIEAALEGGDTCESKLDLLPSELVRLIRDRLKEAR